MEFASGGILNAWKGKNKPVIYIFTKLAITGFYQAVSAPGKQSKG